MINEWPEQRGEDTDEKIVEMAQNQLNLNISKSDIDRSHRVGRPKPGGRPRPIIVKFISYKTKKAVFQARSALSLRTPGGKAKYINEDLTKTRLEMYREAQTLKRDNLVQDSWTTDGHIFVRTTTTAKIQMFDNPVKLKKWAEQLRANPPRQYADVVKEGGSSFQHIHTGRPQR